MAEQGRPPAVLRYIFYVDGVEIGEFMDVGGLTATVQTEEVPEGGNNAFVHKLPKGITHQNITLKRGVATKNALWDWFNKSSGWGLATQNSGMQRSTCGITMLGAGDESDQPLRQWVFTGAFPVKWTGPSFSPDASQVATEELEIAHDGFYVDA